MTPAKSSGDEVVTKVVMRDPVTKAAINHSGKEPSPGRASEQKAEQSETRKRTKGQRAISRIWEDTQMRLAILTVSGFMLAHTFVVLMLGLVLFRQWDNLPEHPASLTALVAILTGSLGAIASLASLVIATYFQRTNSHKVGGVTKDYEGR